MTKKEQTIKACKELRKKYLNPKGKRFFEMSHCPLCDIYTNEDKDCVGCPFSDTYGSAGCLDFTTSDKLWRYLLDKKSKSSKYRLNKYFIARADFFKKIIPILRKIPAKRFTPSGWTYFKELDRNW